MSTTTTQKMWVVDGCYDHTAKGTPVAIICTMRLQPFYVYRLTAVCISPEAGFPGYLTANPGVTVNNVCSDVNGVGRLTGRRRGATAKTPPQVEVEFTEYGGNSADEAREIIAAM